MYLVYLLTEETSRVYSFYHFNNHFVVVSYTPILKTAKMPDTCQKHGNNLARLVGHGPDVKESQNR